MDLTQPEIQIAKSENTKLLAYKIQLKFIIKDHKAKVKFPCQGHYIGN